MSQWKGPKAAAFGVAVAYAALTTLYIIVSDSLLELIVPDASEYKALQTVKGMSVLLLSALLLWVLLSRVWVRLDQLLTDVRVARNRLAGALRAAGGAAWRTERDAAGELVVTLNGNPFRDVGAAIEILGDVDTVQTRIHPDFRDAHQRLVDAIVSGEGELAPLTFRIRDKDDNWRWIKTVPDPESRLPGCPDSVSGVAFDVTDLQNARQALEDVIAGGELGTWRHNLHTNRLTVNARWAEMLGYSLEELNPQVIDDWRALVHPDDLRDLTPVHAYKFASRDYYFTSEFRMRHKDGHWVWILSRGKAVETDETGEALVLSGVHMDISQRKALKAALHEKSDFLQRLTETSVSGILSINAEGTIVFANLEAQQILDTDGRGLVGRDQAALGWRSRSSGEGDGPTGFPIERVLQGGEVLRDLRLTLPLSDGTERVISVNAAPMTPRGGVAQIVCSVSDITQRLIDERRLALAAEEARYAARHDPLTGLPNRSLFGAHASAALAEARRDSGLVVQAFLAIDQFQQVKDRFGPVLGDRLICLIAERLERLRSGAQVLARVGAEEFSLLDRLGMAEEVQALTATLAAAFDTPFDLEGQPVFLRASIGVSLFPMDAMNEEELWLNADLAMYEAKALGGNRAVRFTAALRDRMAREALIGQSLQRAIRDRAFELVLQPKVCLNNPAQIAGAEALVRCSDADLAGIGPADFMPVAEKTGLIRAIDLLVIDMVGTFLEELRRRGLALHVAINLSPESLRQSGFGADVLAHAKAAGLSPETVQFELTEGAVIDPQSEARGSIELLLAEGYELSADDFGTGYSSMSYLQQLRLKEIKIDQSFISRLGLDDGASDAIVRATLAMAQALGLRSVAEGVNTQAQVDWLAAQGCDIGQGYHFGRPVSPEVFLENYLQQGPVPESQCRAAR
ncbi:sensor domain-containing protein [Rhodobacter maris]|uniref:Diguanylate cyclase/phosphodiesterase with PAS/PAC sensor(S) n=1 Tax=Rhodobacter maris TaxID=446682 RepID=A0A285RR12_9RHOB|nr:GGDEF domain-containing phosphodiesterase [Rhodobacter maris]SOB94757.1 diguanylate cyclase/phosphodiesterase with PAS/PAC sensor(s) [Rhodobacter maris]